MGQREAMGQISQLQPPDDVEITLSDDGTTGATVRLQLPLAKETRTA